jgi:valyl-tRNA synthetase
LFAPVLPYITEEIWSWHFADNGQSIHTTGWPTVAEVSAVEKPKHAKMFEAAVEVLSKIRGTKTKKKKKLRWPVAKLEVTASKKNLSCLQSVLGDVLRAGNVEKDRVKLIEKTPPEKEMFAVKVKLADSELFGTS